MIIFLYGRIVLKHKKTKSKKKGDSNKNILMVTDSRWRI